MTQVSVIRQSCNEKCEIKYKYLKCSNLFFETDVLLLFMTQMLRRDV